MQTEESKNEKDDFENEGEEYLEEKFRGKQKTKKFFRLGFKRFLIFILSFLIGIFVKLEAKDWVTIGYDDYKLVNIKNDFVDDNKKGKLSQENQAEENNNEGEEVESGNQQQLEQQKEQQLEGQEQNEEQKKQR